MIGREEYATSLSDQFLPCGWYERHGNETAWIQTILLLRVIITVHLKTGRLLRNGALTIYMKSSLPDIHLWPR